MKSIKRWHMLSLISILCIVTAYLALSVNVKPGEAKFNPDSTQHYSCATAFITVTPNGEDPSCPTGSSSSQDMSHYTSSVTVTISGTGHYQLFWGAAAFWCRQPNTPSCHDLLSGSTASHMDVDLSTGSKTVTVPVTGHSGNGTACGNFQNDFGVYLADEHGNRITSAGCPVAFTGDVSTLWANNNMASFCNSTLTCETPTPTPTTVPTNTPTPTTIPTNTPTPTAVPTNTPTPTTAPTSTPIPTTAPTSTPTPTTVPTSTPTAVPTNTPTPTATPTNTPTPTVVLTNTPTPGAGNSQSQTQSQSQTNTQTVNVSVPASTQQVLSASTAPAQLPSTGVPIQNIAFLISLLPVGLKLRKWS